MKQYVLRNQDEDYNIAIVGGWNDENVLGHIECAIADEFGVDMVDLPELEFMPDWGEGVDFTVRLSPDREVTLELEALVTYED